MKVLVTGADGQLGRALAKTAPAHLQVTALSRSALDITDPPSIAAAIAQLAPDLVVNAAAYTAVDRAESEKDLAFAVNGAAPGQLAAAAHGANAGFVHISTDFVFDGHASVAYAPGAPTAPAGVYGASKLAGEQAAMATHPEALIVRTAWVYAAAGGNFVRTMLRLMAERDEVRVVADQIGTPTHADSLARAIWQLAAAKLSGIWNWTDAGVASWYDFAVAIQEEALALGLLSRAVPVIPIRTEDYPTPARRPAFSLLDKQATWAQTGLAAHWRVELRDALEQMKEMTR
ncbi:MAG: dTDP-4-dehydrorhamnose reductase [Sphingomonadaceae bacterium]